MSRVDIVSPYHRGLLLDSWGVWRNDEVIERPKKHSDVAVVTTSAITEIFETH